jgi:uncharacterized protein
MPIEEAIRKVFDPTPSTIETESVDGLPGAGALKVLVIGKGGREHTSDLMTIGLARSFASGIVWAWRMKMKNVLIRAVSLILTIVASSSQSPVSAQIPRKASSSQSPVSAQSPRKTLVDRLLFQPDRFPVGEWPKNDSTIEDVWFRSPDDKRLNGWFAEAKKPRAVVLYMEGNAGNITNRRWVLDLFRDRMNASVLIFDYEGYGRSEGTPTQSAILNDARAARRWLAGRTKVAEKDIVLVGNSLGGAVAVDLASRDGARGLVLENTFASLAELTRTHFGRLASKLVTTELDSAAKISSYTGPLLQTHGDEDSVVPFAQGKRLFAAANEPKKFVAVRGGDHNDGPTPEYLEQLDQFLARLPTQVSKPQK